MSQRITQNELESYLWGAAVLLRGLIDAGDYKQFIFPLVFLKRLSDVYDEEHAAALAEYGDEGRGAWYLQPPTRFTPFPMLVRAIAKRESRDVAANLRALATIKNTREKLDKSYL
jgi:type I restriction-modification system DNA methylase subunit